MKCSLCGASMIEGKIKHIVDMEKQTIIIKDVPALVCKQCGASFLDDEVVEKLEKIVDELLKNRAEIVIANYSEMAA
ncbi:hypothetical protein Csac_1407 [Caldicellulosiruptor saccharolyticus DSM 8903]|uniref:Zinc finger, YgiT-type n=1 Tax=Caldicellulosiruptor saccharolyticus (strain ATCC 43494 / DSM 8903 / Tp8T 6331) TaxID=351627 RepID=A4XJC3_CALS8|nr:type II toxin-antitoxin system MqsA family antitoxin [Caldicellulosiruptor saccharolyticus]ABP67008.1 hypothetical protein Csac_1407 [Caldicellulosiruptor saccharolyticus DSM 8903]